MTNNNFLDLFCQCEVFYYLPAVKSGIIIIIIESLIDIH